MTVRSMLVLVASLSLAVAAGCAGNATPRCAVTADCTDGRRCYRGFCISEVGVDSSVGCEPGFLDCHGCVDVASDEEHCGHCDARCPDTDSCEDGECVWND